MTPKATTFFFLAGLASPRLFVPKSSPLGSAVPGLCVQLSNVSHMTACPETHTEVKDTFRGVGRSGKKISNTPA